MTMEAAQKKAQQLIDDNAVSMCALEWLSHFQLDPLLIALLTF